MQTIFHITQVAELAIFLTVLKLGQGIQTDSFHGSATMFDIPGQGGRELLQGMKVSCWLFSDFILIKWPPTQALVVFCLDNLLTMPADSDNMTQADHCEKICDKSY